MPYFDKITRDDLKALDPKHTIVAVPIGTIEENSHLISMGWSGEAAKDFLVKTSNLLQPNGLSFLILPVHHTGPQAHAHHFSVRYRPHILRDSLLDCVRSFHKRGFRHFLWCSFHSTPGTISLLQEVPRWLPPFFLPNSPRLFTVTSDVLGFHPLHNVWITPSDAGVVPPSDEAVSEKAQQLAKDLAAWMAGAKTDRKYRSSYGWNPFHSTRVRLFGIAFAIVWLILGFMLMNWLKFDSV